jgi:LysM repeat protein
MKSLKFIVIIILSAFLLNACGSSKTGVKTSGKTAGASSTRNSDVQTMKYIAKYKKIAQQKMRDYGIPASITLAQGILESASGTSYLAKQANNHFGIKCADNWNGAKVYKDDDHKNECFRKYKNAEESFNDHSKFLAKRRRYAFLFRLPPTDYEAWAKGLKKAGYATDPSYPSKLIYIIEKYKLYELDEEVLKGMNIKEETVKHNQNDKSEKIIYEVKPGETLYTIAKKFNIPVKEIKEMNNLVDFDIYEGQILVLKMPKDQTGENDEAQSVQTEAGPAETREQVNDTVQPAGNVSVTPKEETKTETPVVEEPVQNN